MLDLFLFTDWIALPISILSVHLLSRKHAYAWHVGIASSTLWIFYGLLTGQLPMILGNVVTMLLQMRGLHAWQKERGQAEDAKPSRKPIVLKLPRHPVQQKRYLVHARATGRRLGDTFTWRTGGDFFVRRARSFW